MRCGDHQYDLPTRFIELAGEINGVMSKYVVDRLVQGSIRKANLSRIR